MLPRKVKRNHDLSHSNNCALFWAEKVRMTAQENLLSKPHPDGRGIGWMPRFWSLGTCSYFHAFALASYPTKPSEPRNQLLTICCGSRWADGASDAWAN